MVQMRCRWLLPLVLLSIGILAGGCGGGSASEGGASVPSHRFVAKNPSRAFAIPPASISVEDVPGVGPVLVDSAHKTLYRFSRDRQGSEKSHCYGNCEYFWYFKPSGGKPVTTPGASEKLTSFIRRIDGPYLQATYDGWPLYTYIREKDRKLEGAFKRAFGGTFYPLRANGSTVYKKTE